MIIVILIILILYVNKILQYRFGWNNNIVTNRSAHPNVSVVVSIRNESHNISQLINSLRSQVYPIENLEFILINDHSTDATLSILENSDLENLKVIDMPVGIFGKKNAINFAIPNAKGDIILLSDADCLFDSYWITTMVGYFRNDSVKLVSGPVVINEKKGFFQKIQSLEFISLIASGAGAIGSNDAIFCNGANMAYKKDVFLELNDYEHETSVSGDDVFLLHRVKREYPKSIVFAKHESAIVTTNSIDSLKSFLNQRIRWTSKSSEYKDTSTIYTSFLVMFTNLSLLTLFFTLLFSNNYIFYFTFFYLIKFLTDYLFLSPALDFFKRHDLKKWIFVFELFYSFYVILIIILSFNRKFEWKGRIHNK